MGSKQEVSPGECVAVCAACGSRVIVPTMAGVPPYINHEPDCGRLGWSVNDAVKYEDGLTATISDWPNGIDHETGRDIAEPDETDARAYVGTSARDLIGDLRSLVRIADWDNDVTTAEIAEALEVGHEEAGNMGEDARLEADERLIEMPLAVEVTTTFEVVLGCGGPDRRLCFECHGSPSRVQPDPHTPPPIEYDIRRVLFSYSWDGSAEIELIGEDREVAEEFGRRVVPELGEF